MTPSIKKYSIVFLVALGACSGTSELNPDPSVIVEDTIITEPSSRREHGSKSNTSL